MCRADCVGRELYEPLVMVSNGDAAERQRDNARFVWIIALRGVE